MDHPNEPHLFVHFAICAVVVILLIVWNAHDLMQVHSAFDFIAYLLR